MCTSYENEVHSAYRKETCHGQSWTKFKVLKLKKNTGGATSLHELMKHSIINMHAKNHGNQGITYSDTGAFV